VADPIEQIVETALLRAGLGFTKDGEGDTRGLDFHVTDFDIFIEVKQFHTDRVAEQMSRVENVIVIQGRRAAEAFARILS